MFKRTEVIGVHRPRQGPGWAYRPGWYECVIRQVGKSHLYGKELWKKKPGSAFCIPAPHPHPGGLGGERGRSSLQGPQEPIGCNLGGDTAEWRVHWAQPSAALLSLKELKGLLKGP